MNRVQEASLDLFQNGEHMEKAARASCLAVIVRATCPGIPRTCAFLLVECGAWLTLDEQSALATAIIERGAANRVMPQLEEGKRDVLDPSIVAMLERSC